MAKVAYPPSADGEAAGSVRDVDLDLARAPSTGRAGERVSSNIRPVCWRHGELLWHHLGMLLWLRQRRAETSQPVCKCGNPLYLRVVGVAQRWGGEPVSAVSCLHCARCGDVKGQ